MARTVVLMRHAKSSWAVETADRLRELSDRGTRDAGVAGAILVERGLRPYVLLSPTRRTRATWEAMAAAGVDPVEVVEADDLYEHDADRIVSRIREVPADVETLLVLGHSPTMPSAVELVAKREHTKPWFAFDEKFPTAGMAFIDVESEWADVGDEPGTLIDFVVPRGKAS